MSGFRPKYVSKEELDEMIEDCIHGIISADADITEIYWWMSILPEALRYMYRKRKKIARTIDEISDSIEELSAKYRLVYVHSSQAPSGSITEKKDFADSMKVVKSPEYKKLKDDLNMFNELINACDADITNLEQKSVMVRKMSNIETSRTIYED